jgi:3-methylcrotonyl-CoA carboxylase alpha subunit
LNAAPKIEVRLRAGDKDFDVRLSPKLGAPRLSVMAEGDKIVVFEHGQAFEFSDAFTDPAAIHAQGDGDIMAPMPGHVLAVNVAAGDAVKKGAALLVMEAMKMEISLAAPFDGVVATLHAKPGDRVAEGFLLARMETQ